MIYLTLALSAALMAGGPHQTSIEHRGATYHITYQPQVQTRMKTVGMAAGTRMSTERCRWSADVKVERIVRRAGRQDGPVKILSGVRTIEGSLPGTCEQARDHILKAQSGRHDIVRRHVAAVAAQDRHALLADIDAAHALASSG